MIDNEPWDKNGFLLHGSAVQTSKGALIFTGPSEAGKSTICDLMSLKFMTISDDCLFVGRSEAGSWLVEDGGAYSWKLRKESYVAGVEREATGGAPGIPVCAVMPLHQSKRVWLEQLDGRPLCLNIMNGIIEIAGQSQRYSTMRVLRWFALAAQMSREVRGLRLHFSKECDTVQVLSKYLEALCSEEKKRTQEECLSG